MNYNGYSQNMNGMYNNYSYAQMSNQNMMPKYEVIKVKGKPGVDAFHMGPNSSVLLLDETANIVWYVETDGAGYKTATPFDVTPHVEQRELIKKYNKKIKHDIDFTKMGV